MPTQIAPDCHFSVASGNVYGAGGLVSAITSANLTPASDIICLTPNGQYHLDRVIEGENGLPEIGSAVILRGHGSTIVRVATAPEFRLLRVAALGHLTIRDVQFANGLAPFGGAIYSSGTLILDQVTITDSTAISDGGALYVNNGSAALTESVLRFNNAVLGGAIYSVGSTTNIYISASQISDNLAANFGGGIFNFSATLTIENSQMLRNRAQQGGATRNQVGGTLIVQGSRISENQAVISGGGLLIDSAASTGSSNCFEDNSAPVGAALHYTALFAITPLDFENNWWGSATGAGAGDLLGLIDVIPWLTIPSPACGSALP